MSGHSKWATIHRKKGLIDAERGKSVRQQAAERDAPYSFGHKKRKQRQRFCNTELNRSVGYDGYGRRQRKIQRRNDRAPRETQCAFFHKNYLRYFFDG